MWYFGYADTVILIPTYYVEDTMGRQHTTWISDETWERLKNIEGKSISGKIANAVKAADPDHEMIIKAKLRQLNSAKRTLRAIAMAIQFDHTRVCDLTAQVDEILSEVWFLWEANVDA